LRFLSLHSDVAVPALVKAIDDPARNVRLGALGALGTCGGRGKPYPDVVARIRDLALSDSDAAIREYAPQVLVKFTAHRDEALAFMREATASPDDAIRSGAFQSLWHLDPNNEGDNEDDALMQTVIRGLSDRNADVRQSAAAYVEREISAEQIAPYSSSLEALRHSDDPVVAASVIRALASLALWQQEAASPVPHP
jgi:HEAT repeat protein